MQINFCLTEPSWTPDMKQKMMTLDVKDLFVHLLVTEVTTCIRKLPLENNNTETSKPKGLKLLLKECTETKIISIQ
jgi:hypothetical protein